MGALADFGILVVGLVAGWLRFRRPLSAAWSRSGPVMAAETSYRAVAQTVPIAGASRLVRWLLAYVYTLAFVAAARIGFTWVAMQNIYDHGHERSGLVPSGDRGIGLLIAIALQAVWMLVVVPRAARSLAYRRDEGGDLAPVAVGIGAIVALLDAAVLYRATRKPPIYWIAQMLVDDVAYAVLCIAGVIALVLLTRAERAAPPVVEAAVTKPTRREANRARALEVAAVVATIATMGHALAYARDRYRFSQELDGEVEVAIDDPDPITSDDYLYVYWMPSDSSPLYDGEKETPYGKVKTKWRLFTRNTTQLQLEYWERKPEDDRTLMQLCREGARKTSDTTCDLEAGDRHDRVVVQDARVYELRAENLKSPAARLFLDTFRTRGLPK